ncbi:MAG: hypothetical protein CVU91_07480 [Firmicutes bacterium HGW-Firmicutes-16]|nr:MAG: hypothetical protein CVU91_07480 [Firmicutes bacterium HGW-Firmicutes-16]
MGTIISDIKLDLSMVDDEAADISRCLALLYSTPKGTIPMAREFGLSKSFSDLPAGTAKSLLAAEIIKQTAAFETRVTVTGITWETDESGHISAKVAIASV